MTVILGIDPGLTGALAWLHHDGHLLGVVDMPVLGGEVNAAMLLMDDELREGRVDQAILEWPGVMPHDGRAQCRSMGITLGTLSTVLTARHIPVHRVAPGTWKRALNLTSNKDQSRAMAMRQWPTMAHQFTRKKDDGRAEAALLAWWWLTKKMTAIGAA